MASKITAKKLYRAYHSIEITDLIVEGNAGVHMSQVKKMKEWISDNKTDDVYLYNGQFWFESELDKTNFLIAWR